MKAIIRHTATVYQALNDESKLEDIGEEHNARIFRGKLTEVFKSTGVGATYYSEVFRQLDEQGCVTLLQRGSKSVDSVVILHRPPSPDGYLPPPKSPLTNPERYANLQEDVEALKTLVGGIHIAEALKEIEDRFKKLESS